MVAFRALPVRLFAVAIIPFFASLPARAQYGGGPPGGYSGRGGFDPGEIIKRMDDNENGQIDPQEMEGRARGMLEEMARQHNLDLTKPIPNDKLRDLIRARFQGGPPGGPSPGGSSSSGSTSSSGRTANSPVSVKGFGDEGISAVVPGFGVAAGESWDVLKGKYEPRVIEKIEEALGRNDRNKDGIIDAEELKRAELSGNPLDYDKNRDGQLSRSELAERYKERYATGYYDRGRGGPQGGPQGAPQGGYGGYGGPPMGGGYGGGNYGGGFNQGGGMVVVTTGAGPATAAATSSPPANSSTANKPQSYGPPPAAAATTPAAASPASSNTATAAASPPPANLDEKYLKYADGLLKQYDDNKNGKLEREEWSRMKTDYHKSDRDGNGFITREELASHLAGFTRSGPASISANSPPPSSATASAASPSSVQPPRSGDSNRSSGYGQRSASAATSKGGPRKTYRFLSPAERLPAGLPDWFTRNDAAGDGDGQVSMAEFSSTWNDEKAAEFVRWDRNGDGLITPKEAASAP